MSFSIRLARSEEALSLPALERSAAQAFCSVPDLARLAEGDVLPVATHLASIAQATCWVAVDGHGRAVGFLTAQRYGRDLHIQEMSVMLAAQGQGLGRRLLMVACDHAQAAGLLRVTLTTFVAVPWNAPFYAKAGFCIIPPPMLDQRLAALLREEENSLAGGARCAMQHNLAQRG